MFFKLMIKMYSKDLAVKTKQFHLNINKDRQINQKKNLKWKVQQE